MPMLHFPEKKNLPPVVSGIQTGRTDIKKIRVPRQLLLRGTLILFGGSKRPIYLFINRSNAICSYLVLGRP